MNLCLVEAGELITLMLHEQPVRLVVGDLIDLDDGPDEPTYAIGLRVFRSVHSVDGRAQPCLWQPTTYDPVPEPNLLVIATHSVPSGFVCPGCSRSVQWLLRIGAGQYRCDGCPDSNPNGQGIAGKEGLIFEQAGHRLVLAPSSTTTPPDRVPAGLVGALTARWE